MSDINFEAMGEKQILELLQSFKICLNAKLTTDKYCRYDAETDKSIIEFKYREKSYNDYLIEAHKLVENFQTSQQKGKNFFYVVVTKKSVHVWNITELIVHSPKTSFYPKLMPKSFVDRSKIWKLCLFLDTKDSTNLKR